MRIAVNAVAAKAFGSMTYLLNLLPELHKARPDNELIVYVNSSSEAEMRRFGIADLPGVQLRKTGVSSRSVPRYLWELTRLGSHLESDAANVLFSPVPPLPLRAPCPLVVALRNMDPYCGIDSPNLTKAEWARLRFLRIADRDAVRRATRVILVSRASQELLGRFNVLQAARVSIIPHGINASFRPLAADEIKDALDGNIQLPNQPFILHVTSFRPYKNDVALLHAFAVLRHRMRDIDLLIAGTGDQARLRTIHRTIRTLGLGASVRILGYVDYKLLPALYSAAAVLAFPSRCEACPNTIIEAMGCGLPMVSAGIAPVRELAEDVALYADPYRAVDFAEALEHALTDSATRMRLSQGGLERAARLPWQETAKRTLDVIEAAAAAASPR